MGQKRFGIDNAQRRPSAADVARGPGLPEQRRQTRGLTAAVVIGQFLLIGGLLLQRRRRRRAELAVRDLGGRLIAAQEAERARLARDLHDDVGQQLAALSIAISGVERRAATVSGQKDLHDQIVSLRQMAVKLAENVRELSHDLHPDVLRHVGLAASLNAYCDGLSISPTLRVTCTTQGDFSTIEPEAAVCLYRIAQEALHNVVKHAHAHQARVQLLRIGDKAQITIADDGKGFDAQAHGIGAGLGLVSITERARLSGGQVKVATALNKGTKIQVRIPLRTTLTSAAPAI